MVFDTTDKKIEMTFGSARVNNWQKFEIQPLQEQEILVNLPCEKAGKEFFKVL